MRFLTSTIAVCAVAAMFASDAQAQRRGGGWGGGGGRGWGGNNWGGNNWGGNYYGGYGRSYYGGGYYPGWGNNYGYGWGNNWNRGGYYSNYGYSYPNYSYSYPTQQYYYSDNTYYSNPTTSAYQPSMPNPNVAGVRVIVPDESAQVMIQGQQMQQMGRQRDFVSPTLEPGKTYTYTVDATWMVNGQAVTRQKQVDVAAGQNVIVDFNVQ